MTDLPENTYYWSVKARNDQVGVNSPSAGPVQWLGPNITDYNSNTYCFVRTAGYPNTYPAGDVLEIFDTTANIQYDWDPKPCLGGNITLQSATAGFVLPDTYVVENISNTLIRVNQAPVPILANACISITCLNPDNGEPAGGITGNSIQDGTIGFDKIDGNVNISNFVAREDWIVSDNGILVPPVLYATNAPSIIRPTTTPISSTKYYPFFQGTSSTADGYDANSTGSLQPADAAEAGFLAGDNDWYPLASVFLPGGIPSFENFELDAVFQFVSASDTSIQITPFAKFLFGTTFNTDDQFTHTIELKANKPVIFGLIDQYSAYSIPFFFPMEYLGYLWRALDSNDTYCIEGKVEVNRFKYVT